MKYLTIALFLIITNIALASDEETKVYYPDGTTVQGCPGDPVIYGCGR